MSAPVVQGWCPGALRPMMSGDGLVVRIRAPLGQLSAAQAQGLADLAERHGSGLIDLSIRANLQLRGVTETSYPALIDGLRALDLVDETVAQETRRNITLTPFWEAQDDSHKAAQSLSDALSAQDAPNLPGKFGFAIDCGPAPVLRDTPADIRIERAATGGLICRADGATTGVAVTTDNCTDAALQLAEWFLTSGGAPEGRGRMARHLARPDVVLPEQFQGHAPGFAQTPAAPKAGDGPEQGGTLVALAFGQIPARTLRALATQILRLTPWRMLYLPTATKAARDLLQRLQAKHDALILDPDDPRLKISACTGAPGCPQALGPTRALAASLKPDTALHIAGCAKGCAHPSAAPWTLVARGPDHYDLIANGRASDMPVTFHLDAATLRRTYTDLTTF